MYFELQGRMTAQTADIIQVKCCQRLAQNTKQIYNCNSKTVLKQGVILFRGLSKLVGGAETDALA